MYKQTLSEFSTFDTPGQFFKLFVLSLGMLARRDWNLLDTALFDHRPVIMEAESDLIRRTSAPQACFWTRVKSVCVASMQKPTFGPIIVTLCQLPILHNPHICLIIPFFFFFRFWLHSLLNGIGYAIFVTNRQATKGQKLA